MIPRRRLLECGFPLLYDRRRLKEAPSFCRKFSIVIARTPSRSTPGAHLLSKASQPWHFSQAPSKPAIHLLITRFASSIPNGPPTVDAAPFAVPTNTFTSTSLDSITTSDLSPQVSEHLGYLKEMGLDYGWGPTAFVETLLEHVHIYAGTPWWASIVLTALVVRVALLRSYVQASDTAARAAVLKPYTDPIRARLTEARNARDQAGMMQATQDIRAMHRNANVQTWKLAVPMLQIPLGFGTFRLMRGMGDLPVPGLETGGLLWMKDLTLADPYFILPVLTAAAVHYTFKLGGEASQNTSISPKMLNFFTYLMPVITGTFMLFWPGCMQLTFFFTSVLSLTQASVLRQPSFRAWLNMQPLPPRPISPTSSPSPYTGTITTTARSTPLEPKRGFIEGAIAEVKGVAGQVMKSGREMATKAPEEKKGVRSKAEKEKARKYEEMRKREIKQERFMADQAKMARRRERDRE